MDESKFFEEAERWDVFLGTVREARAAFADVIPEGLQKAIDEGRRGSARAKYGNPLS